MQRLPLINRFQGCLAGLAIAAANSPESSFPEAATQIALALSQPPHRLTDDGMLASHLSADGSMLDWAIALIPAFLLGHESPESLARLLPPTLLAQFTPSLRTIAGLFALALNPSALNPSQGDRWQTLSTWITSPHLASPGGALNASSDRGGDRGLETLRQLQDWQRQGLSGSDVRLGLAPGRSISALDSDLADPDFVPFFYDQTYQICASDPVIHCCRVAPKSSIPAMQLHMLAIALTGTQAGLMGLPLRWRLAWQPDDRDRTLELADRLWYTWSGLHRTAIGAAPLLAPLIQPPRALNPPH